MGAGRRKKRQEKRKEQEGEEKGLGSQYQEHAPVT